MEKNHHQHVVEKGLSDWIPSFSSVTCTIGATEKFISANKNTTKNTANVADKVAKAGETTASAIKQTVNVIKTK